MYASQSQEVLVGRHYTIFERAGELVRRLYESKSQENLQNHPKLIEDGSIIRAENENLGPHINGRSEAEGVEVFI